MEATRFRFWQRKNEKVKRWFMYLQTRLQTHVTSVLYYRFNPGLMCSGTNLFVIGFPFGNCEDQESQPDKTECEQLGHAKGLVEKENSQ